MYHKQSWTGKGLNVGLTLIMLLLALAPAGEARELEKASQYDLTQLPTAPAGTLGDTNEPAEASLSDLGALWRLPFLRSDHSAIYDAPNDRIIVFGGWNGRQFFNDVWALDTTEGSEAWTKLNPDSAWPPSRAQHTAIYDAANNRMVVFGGHSSHYNFDDVWALDLTPGAETWTDLSPTGLPIGARRYHSAVYDATNDRMVVFGGSGRGGLRNDTWALDLTPGAETWSQLAVTGSAPAARWQHTAIYDAENGLMVVFGGPSGGALLNDAWSLNLTTQHWAALSPAGDPPPTRRKHSAVFHHPLGTPYGWMIVFGGLGNGGFLDDAWYLRLTPGEIEWFQTVPTSPSSPAARAGHAAAQINEESDYRMVVLGGRGMGSLAGETQWVYDVPTVSWSPLTPDLPSWWQGGTAVQSVRSPQSNGRPDVTLQIEDAPADTTVNVLPNQEVWFVTKIKTSSSAYANDIDVTLDVVAPKFEVVQVGTRYKDAHEVTNWTTPTALGGGRYRLEDVDLEKRGSDSKYQMQVVFKADVKADAPLGGTSINVVTEGPNWPAALDYNAYASIRANPRAWIITNRTQLFDDYTNSEVRSLLDKVFEIAQGGAEYNNSPPAVVLYADRYVPALQTWDNTTVNYASEATANHVANLLDQWLDQWISYPNYLAILGDDNIIPFYRQYDETGGEEDASYIYNYDPVLTALVSNNYFFTDNPYGDVAAVSTDWETGDLEIAVGRIVGGTAADMQKALQNGTESPNPDSGRVIIASGEDMDWHLPGPQNDAVYPFNLMGYDYNNQLVDANPSKTDVTREMAKGFAAMLLGGHGTVKGWVTPGGFGDDWEDDTANGIDGGEMPLYDADGNVSQGRIFYNFVSCRTGYSHNNLGSHGSMIYALTHHEASGGIASAGLSCCVSDQDVLAPDETLLNDFWVVAARDETRTDPLGWALMRAKERFTSVYGASADEKTIQEYTFFGLPWMRMSGAPAQSVLAAQPQESDVAIWSTPRPAAPQLTYAVTTTVDASIYAITQTTEGFDLIQVEGMGATFNEGKPALPFATIELVLPLSATVTSLVFTPTQPVTLNLDIPSLQFETGGTAITATYTSTIDSTYPVTAGLESSMMDSYQLVQVNVVPVTYDATNDQATLYHRVDVRVEYDTPHTIALTRFEPDQSQYQPGDTISTTAHLVNAGDVSETVTATLIIQDAQGQIVGFQGSGAFDIPAGETYDLSLGWTGPLDGDTYAARLFVWQSGQVVAGAGQEVFVTAGEIAEFSVPEQILPGQTGTFTVTFENHSANATIAIASLTIYDADDALVAFLEPQAAVVPGEDSRALTFSWTPERAGTYVASAVVSGGGQEYGPISQNFRTGYQVFLPVVIRSSGA